MRKKKIVFYKLKIIINCEKKSKYQLKVFFGKFAKSIYWHKTRYINTIKELRAILESEIRFGEKTNKQTRHSSYD